ncbi:MAG: GNAT family N-acetyltransferase [Candidatus Hydrogenedentota bacterium]|nr:MAG: GNAT family N-acetyltransferase [Candidatus Hydrogenedentota bacterium]
MTITNLKEESYFSILNELPDFWSSSADTMRPYHHIMFAKYFPEVSFVAIEHQKIIGYLYAILSANQQKTFIHLIAVRKGYYRKKIATVLLNKLESTLSHLFPKCRQIEAYCIKENRLGIAFFSNRGFLQQGILQTQEKEAILFRKPVKNCCTK